MKKKQQGRADGRPGGRAVNTLNSEAVPRRLISREEAASMIGVKWATLWQWSQSGILKPVQLPSTARRRPQDIRLRRVLYDINDIHTFIDEMKAHG